MHAAKVLVTSLALAGAAVVGVNAATVVSPLGRAVAKGVVNYSGSVPRGSLQMFRTASAARPHCGSDPVVWVNTRERRFRLPPAHNLAASGPGGYACEHEALAAGDRPEPSR